MLIVVAPGRSRPQGDLRIEPLLQPLTQRPTAMCREAVEGPGCAQGRFEQRPSRGEACEHMTLPCNGESAAIFRDQFERIVRRIHQRIGAAVELVAEAAVGGG